MIRVFHVVTGVLISLGLWSCWSCITYIYVTISEPFPDWPHWKEIKSWVKKNTKTRGHVNETVAARGFLSENHVGPCHLLEKSPCSWGETDPNILPGSNRKRMGLTGMTALKTTSRMSQVHTSCLHTGHYIKTSRHPFNRLWNPELFGEGGKFCSSELKTSKNHWQVQWNTSVYLERELYTFHHNSLDIIHYPWT